MHKLLEKFSRLMGTGVIFTYLFGLFAGTATYFVGHLIGNDTSFSFAVGIALAVSIEIHSFLSQRLTRSLWQQLHKMDETDDGYDDIKGQFKLHLWITIGLVTFSMINSTAFWIVTTRPQSFWEWVSTIVRGAVIPAAFLAAGFLTPLTHDASQMLADTAHTMLHKTTKAMAKQWKARIKQAQKQKLDLAPIAIALMQEEGDHKAARRISIIAEALSAAERGIAGPKSSMSVVPALKLASTQAPTLPQPPMELPEAMAPADELYVVAKPKTTTGSRQTARSSGAKSKAKGGRKPYPTRDTRTDAEKETDCRRIIAENGGVKNISAYKVANLAKVSTSTASKWWHTVEEGR